MPEFPEGLAALRADLEQIGFTTESETWHLWPRGGELQLRRARTHGVRRVRMVEDRGLWDVEVQIGRSWYEPFTALRALDELLHHERALSHADRREAVVELVRRFTGERSQRQAIRKRASDLSKAYTRWARGKGDYPPA